MKSMCERNRESVVIFPDFPPYFWVSVSLQCSFLLFKALSFFLTCRLSLFFLLFLLVPSKSPPPPQNALCALAREHGVISRPLSPPRLSPTSPTCQNTPSPTQAGNVCVCVFLFLCAFQQPLVCLFLCDKHIV